ncbi:hypothetical protein L1049_015825 [Liquidambar formosana]|uniref:DC1 domain-containing protein n=1 Tax=Liquidambar formosana TaxID=63359 RepID=A0AAP0S5G9_LIQFO
MTIYPEISQFSHSQHNLKLEYTKVPFKCDGCKEIGIGSHYRCSFQFLSRPPGDKPRYCNACEREVTGFVYHCKACGFDLHPCCAKLPTEHDGGGEVKLYLYKKVSAPCDKCGKKGRSWCYRSACKKYNFHVACVKDMMVESWHEGGNTSLKGAVLQTHQTNHNKSKGGKMKKSCEIAGLVLQFVISAVLGDPTALIGGVIGSVVSRW